MKDVKVGEIDTKENGKNDTKENDHEIYENESFDDKNEVAVEKEMELKAMKVEVKNDKIKDIKLYENNHEDYEN